MLSILIIDDTPQKIDTLRDFLLENFPELHGNDISEASYTKQGLNMMMHNQYDLVLLDLFIPDKNNGTPNPKNAADLLGFINELDGVKKPCHILGITQMTGIPPEHTQTFEDNLWSLLRYGADINDWEEKLRVKIRYLLDSKHQLINNCSYNYYVAIVNSLQDLENGMIRSWEGVEWKPVSMPSDECSTYYEAIIEPQGRRIRCVTTYAARMGMTATSVVTTKLINLFRPRYLFMTGICACLKSDKANMGDIIVASSIVDGASGKHAEKNSEHLFVPDYHVFETNEDFINKIRKIKENDELFSRIRSVVRRGVTPSSHVLQLHVGSVASVPAVVADKEVIKSLHANDRNLLGLEMEAYGMYFAAKHSLKPHPQYVAVIKSATDFADKTKDDTYQPYGAMTSAEFLFYLLKEELDYGR